MDSLPVVSVGSSWRSCDVSGENRSVVSDATKEGSCPSVSFRHVYDQHAAAQELHCSFRIQPITMAKRLSLSCLRRLRQQTRRPFSTTIRPHTDGVFRALTENRIQTPWIDALREKERGGHDPTKPSGKPETPNDRDLSPKRMSDSYHSVVLPLAREPWLLDTYANSSGHIRLGTLFMDLDALSTSFLQAHPVASH